MINVQRIENAALFFKTQRSNGMQCHESAVAIRIDQQIEVAGQR